MNTRVLIPWMLACTALTASAQKLFTVNDDPNPQREPNIAYQPAEDVYLAVWEEGGTNKNVIAQRFRKDGTLIGNQINVETGPESARAPAVCAVRGTFLVVFQVNNGTSKDIRARNVSARDGSMSATWDIATTFTNETSPDVVSRRDPRSGDVTIVWNDDVFGVLSQAAEVNWNGGGTFRLVGSPVQVSPLFLPPDPNVAPSVSKSTDTGVFLVAWQANPYVIAVRFLDMSGNLLSEVGSVMGQNVPLPPFLEVDQPSVAGDGTEFAIAYRRREWTGSAHDVWRRRIRLPVNGSGEPPLVNNMGSPHTVNDGVEQERPSLSIVRGDPLLWAVSFTEADRVKVRAMSGTAFRDMREDTYDSFGVFTTSIYSEYEGGATGRADGAVILTYGFGGTPGTDHNILGARWTAPRGQESANGWGAPYLFPPPPPAGLWYEEFSIGRGHALGLLSDGNVLAWGSDYMGRATVPGLPMGNGVQVVYTSVAAGAEHSLALRSDGVIVPFGSNAQGQLPPQGGGERYVEIAAGEYHSVARLEDGTLRAWGPSTQTNYPSGCFAEIAAFGTGDWSLGRRCDGSLVAWGSSGPVSQVPAGNDFVEIAAGETFGLARRRDGTLVAWGDDTYNQVSHRPTGNDFVEIAAARSSGLARRRDGSVVMWSTPTSPVPRGTYLGIAAGNQVSLGRLASASNLGGACGSGGTLSVHGEAAIGGSFRFDLTNAGGGASSVTFLVMSGNPTVYPEGGCELLLFNNVPGLSLPTSNGNASLPISLPWEPSWVGYTSYQQFLTLTLGDPNPNGVPVGLSNILAVTIGI
ncbi:MAG: hypothetical protein H6834_08940 [Planctomycetes bacterium]|nr:hypothetical protein [Planctomycetota bacterium]